MKACKLTLVCALVVFLTLSSAVACAQAAAEAAGTTSAGTAAASGMTGLKQAMPTMPKEVQQQQQQQPAVQTPQAPVPAQDQAALPQTQQVTAGTAPLRVMVGKSLLVNTADRLRRVSVTDPSVADAIVVTPNQVLVHGRAPGEISLLLWNEQEQSRSFDLRVDVDATAAAEEIKHIFPDENIQVSASRSAIVLAGHVTNEDVVKRAALLAGAYSKTVINVMTFGPQGAQEVLLEVKFAEVDRAALSQLGLNIISTGAAGNVGQITTGQFSPTGTVNLTGQIGSSLTGYTTNFPALEMLNLFVFRPDLNLGVAIKALANKSIMQILAEPNLIAVNGKEASFLAGGEYPIPVVQGGNNNAITIVYKEYGVRLTFMPVITPNGNIHLQVKPEVSSLDYTNGIRLAGYTIPALTTRRAQTELEIKDGQSFVIAGLMDNRVTKEMSKVPGIGDIPILGNLFRSRNLQKNKTELMVLVTARRVAPDSAPATLPKMPEPLLDQPKQPAGGTQ